MSISFVICLIFRREGLANHFLGGQSPPLTDEPNTETLDVDYGYFDNVVWPNLCHRVPSFGNIKVLTESVSCTTSSYHLLPMYSMTYLGGALCMYIQWAY
jgi:hypothetical protein